MKVVYKIALLIVLAAFSFGSVDAQPRVTVDARFSIPAPPFVIVAPPPPPFPGAVWMEGGHVWHKGRYVYAPPRYVHRHEMRKWKRAHHRHHEHHNDYYREKKHHQKKYRKHRNH